MIETLYWIILGISLLISYFLWVDYVRKKHDELKNNKFRMLIEIGYLIVFFIWICLLAYSFNYTYSFFFTL